MIGRSLALCMEKICTSHGIKVHIWAEAIRFYSCTCFTLRHRHLSENVILDPRVDSRFGSWCAGVVSFILEATRAGRYLRFEYLERGIFTVRNSQFAQLGSIFDGFGYVLRNKKVSVGEEKISG